LETCTLQKRPLIHKNLNTNLAIYLFVKYRRNEADKKAQSQIFKQDTSQISPFTMTVKIIQIGERFVSNRNAKQRAIFNTLHCTRIKPPVRNGGTFKSQVHKNAKRHDSTYLEYKYVAYIKVTCFDKNLTDF